MPRAKGRKGLAGTLCEVMPLSVVWVVERRLSTSRRAPVVVA